MAAEQQLFLDPEATDSSSEHSERRLRSEEQTGCKRTASLGLGLAALLAFAVTASWGTSAKSGKVSALMELSGSRNTSSGFGKASVCGSGEEIEETTCAEEGSLVRSQGRAVAFMTLGCTGWLVKSETSSTGALMLTTGHCANDEEAHFVFDYVKPCGGGQHPSQDKKCKGTRRIAKVDEDFEAFYELEKPCSFTHTRIPIKLDVGTPDVDEGIYIIGHPNARPQFLSHEELNDDGHHCRFTHIGSHNAFYYCDTQGGNSGSPVFSTLTGHAIAIHKWGGCRPGQTDDGSNGGTLLHLDSVKASLRQLDIPFVDRSQTDLTYQGTFTEGGTCEASNVRIQGRDLDECKKLCLNSLSCTAIAHASSTCYITAVRGTSSQRCPAGAKYFSLQSRSLYRAPPDTTSPGGLCADTCSHPDDGECDDGGASSHYDICDLGTDCKDCGVRHEKKQGKCENTCKYANDRECDDGGKNSHYSVCDLGTDCDDCGEREL